MKISYGQPDLASDLGVWLVHLAGFEPATRCLEDAAQVSETVAHPRK